MIIAFIKKTEGIIKETRFERIKDHSKQDILWIDLNDPTITEKKSIEDYLEIDFQTRQQLEEIESSSRYYETETNIIANSDFFVQQNGSYSEEPVSFILKTKILISLRHFDSKSFIETTKKLETNFRNYPTGFHIMIALFETRIDLDADQIEHLAKEISIINRKLSHAKHLNSDTLLDIAECQEKTMVIREGIIDKQRVISGILKSDRFPADIQPKLRVMIKDIGSLLDYTTFSFERLEYLQDTFIGLINIEQNKIIKIFTIVSVVFMPPTLIASIYGMNFKVIPETGWTYGYPFAIVLMIVSSLITLMLFKKRKWL